MKSIYSLTKRNLLMFFRNKSEVFFSFLSVIIILVVYILFLSDVQVHNIKQLAGDVEGIKPLVNAWVMSGLIAVATVTLSLGALGRIVADKQNKVLNDFLVAPIKRTHVFISYIISTLFIAFTISFSLLILAEIYILISGGTLLTITQLSQVVGIIILCVISSSLFLLFIVSFLNNEQSLSVFASIVGVLIGFVTGAYIPMGIMPKGVQFFSNILPVSQGASLLRKIFVEQPMNIVFENAPVEQNINFSNTQGINLFLGNYELTSNFMVIYIILSIIIFGVLNVIRFKKMKNI